MNTNDIKRFARDARRKLLDIVGKKLEDVLTADTAELKGKAAQIQELKKQIQHSGKQLVIERVAYTWFNRLMALRFLDANGYTNPKVVTCASSKFHPVNKSIRGGGLLTFLSKMLNVFQSCPRGF